MTTTINLCPNCLGKGTYLAAVAWSDGLGMAEHTCRLCDGDGQLSADLATLALMYKRSAEHAERELRSLKTHVALYLSIEDTGDTPNPPLADAPRPSGHLSTWRAYLDDAVANLPRVTS